MYLGYKDYYNKFHSIYEVCNDVIRSFLNNNPRLILDLGSRYGEGFLELGINYNCKYIFVEPSPNCIPKIEELIANYAEREFQLVRGMLGETTGTRKLILFEKDNDLSANLYSKRKGKYGKQKKVPIQVFDYSVIQEDIIDFAKINIEGGEYDLIDSKFFEKIQSFVMEAHNNLVPNKTYKDIIKVLEKKYDLMTYANLDYKYCCIIGKKL